MNYKDLIQNKPKTPEFNMLKKKNSSDLNKNYVFIIHGTETFMSSFNTDTQRKLKTLFSNLKNIKSIRIIFSDSVSKLKLYEYEDFFRNCVQPLNALCVGSCITYQYTIKS